MIYFFFYNHLMDEPLIRKLSNDCFIQNGFIHVESFDKTKDKLFIGNQSLVLHGKLISFGSITLSSILEKLSFLPDIKYKNRSKYILEEINVHTQKEIVRAYIIY